MGPRWLERLHLESITYPANEMLSFEKSKMMDLSNVTVMFIWFDSFRPFAVWPTNYTVTIAPLHFHFPLEVRTIS